MSNELVEKLMQRPDAPLLVQQLNNKLSEEHARRLTFYDWIDEQTKAEFINGQVVVHSPVKRRHWQVTDLLSSVLSVFVRVKGLGVVGTEKVMISLTRNDYEPDIVFFDKAKSAGFSPDQVLFPAPDLVVEVISRKTEKNDRGIKKEDYAAHGIPEYWIIDPYKEQIEQYLLLQPDHKTYFEPFIYRKGDEVSSKMVPGFTIPVMAVFDENANLAALSALLR